MGISVRGRSRRVDEQVEEAGEQIDECLVIGPIGDRLAPKGSPDRIVYEQGLEVFEEGIVPACDTVNLAPIRADRVDRAGDITDQIFRLLRDAPGRYCGSHRSQPKRDV